MPGDIENPGDVGSRVREGFLEETGVETKALIVSKLKAQIQEEKTKGRACVKTLDGERGCHAPEEFKQVGKIAFSIRSLRIRA